MVTVEEHVLPVSSRVLMSCSPTMAGMLSERAMIAVCDVRLPASVAKPRTNSRLSIAVSEGVRLCASRMCG